MLEHIFALITLIAMEVALGIDNVIFVSILAGKLPDEQRARMRRAWMIAGIIIRSILLILLAWLIGILNEPFFTLELLNRSLPISGKQIIMLVGGLFLIYKSVKEIHDKLEFQPEHEDVGPPKTQSFTSVFIQIITIDLVFSIDSIVTAIGMAESAWVMVTAVVVAMVGMFIFAKPLSNFVFKHPTFKMLALSFLLMIGLLLVADGLGQHLSKGYVYFAMIFSLFVELLNMRMRKVKNHKPVELHMPGSEDAEQLEETRIETEA